jgi:hypothetical protein
MINPFPLGSFLAALLLVACGNPNSAPPTSPTNDVQPPTTTTGDGEVMGADRVPPGQKLEQGPRLDSQQGLKPAAKPPGE